MRVSIRRSLRRAAAAVAVLGLALLVPMAAAGAQDCPAQPVKGATGKAAASQSAPWAPCERSLTAEQAERDKLQRDLEARRADLADAQVRGRPAEIRQAERRLGQTQREWQALQGNDY